MQFPGIPQNKYPGGELRGKCFRCGLDVNLNVHSQCSIPKVERKDRKTDIPKRICDNLDCRKEYKPIQSNQKFCSSCKTMIKNIANEKATTKLCNY